MSNHNLLITIETDIHIVNFNLVNQGFEPMYQSFEPIDIKKHSNYPSNFLCQLQKLITKQISEILSEEIKNYSKIALLKTWAKEIRTLLKSATAVCETNSALLSQSQRIMSKDVNKRKNMDVVIKLKVNVHSTSNV